MEKDYDTLEILDDGKVIYIDSDAERTLQASEFTVVFNSDYIVHLDGFKMNWECFESTCGNQTTSDDNKSGYIASKSPYENDLRCEWNIEPSCSEIQLAFIFIDLENEATCKSDHVQIFDNKEYSSTREWSAGTSFPFSEQPSETIIFEPTTESTAEARFESTTETTIEPTTEPTTESTAEARSESTTETTIGRPTKPTTESTAEAKSESTTETTIEPTTEPTTKSTAEARSESTTETTIESTTESTTELRAEPTTKSTTRTSTTSQTSTTQNVDRRKKRSHESEDESYTIPPVLPIAQFCGSYPGKVQVFQGRNFKVVFKSDSDLTGKGFALAWQCGDGTADFDYGDIDLEERENLEVPEDINQMPAGITCPANSIEQRRGLGLMSGASVVNSQAWPWFVMVLNFDYESGSQNFRPCTGTIISSQFIITSSRCCHDDTSFVSTVFKDIDDYAEYEQQSSNNMKIVQIRARFGNMCLMEIPRLTWSENMGFTCLPDSPLIFSKEINEQADGCFTAGVGPHKESESLIDIMDIKTVLRKVNVTDCGSNYLCATASDGEDFGFCHKKNWFSDQGNPLICIIDNEPILFGIAANVAEDCKNRVAFQKIDIEWLDLYATKDFVTEDCGNFDLTGKSGFIKGVQYDRSENIAGASCTWEVNPSCKKVNWDFTQFKLDSQISTPDDLYYYLYDEIFAQQCIDESIALTFADGSSFGPICEFQTSKTRCGEERNNGIRGFIDFRYKNKQSCSWEITPNCPAVKWIFKNFNVEKEFKCGYDHVILKDEFGSTGEMCGETAAEDDYYSIGTEYYDEGIDSKVLTGKFEVIFKTDEATKFNNFKFIWECIDDTYFSDGTDINDDEIRMRFQNEAPFILSLTRPLYKDSSSTFNFVWECVDDEEPKEVNFAAKKCGFQVENDDSTAGYVSSYGYYLPEADCEFIIQTSCEKVRYVIDKIDIEYSSQCNYDNLIVEAADTERETFCGKNNGMMKNIDADKFFVSLKSDGWTQGTGFKIAWQCDNDDTDDFIYGTNNYTETDDLDRHNLPDGVSCPANILTDVKQSRLTQSVDAKKGNWPWLVKLIYPSTGDLFCGGSIIDKQWVLTAGHCCESVYNVAIEVGTHASSLNGTIYEVEEIKIHPGYKMERPAPKNDICLLKLYKDIEFNNDVGLVCLPDINEHKIDENSQCYTAGFGTTKFFQDEAKVLQTAKMDVMPDQDCLEMIKDVQNATFTNKKTRKRRQINWDDFDELDFDELDFDELMENYFGVNFTDEKDEIYYDKYDDNKYENYTQDALLIDFNVEFCAGNTKTPETVCHGDSGSPYICLEANEPILYGLTSWGTYCEPPSVFVKVTTFMDWIIETVKNA